MSTLKVSSIRSRPASNNVVSMINGSRLVSSGFIVQTNTITSTTAATYSSAITGNGTTIGVLGLTITPKYADSLLVMWWMMNGEISENNVFVMHKDGALITTSGYQGYNTVDGNARWSGIIPSTYDADTNSTAANWKIQYAIPAESTATRTYAPAVRASGGTAYTFTINKVTAALASAYEKLQSTGVIMEIKQ